MELPATWISQYSKNIHKPTSLFTIHVGKQRRGGFDANIGVEKFTRVLNCMKKCDRFQKSRGEHTVNKHVYSSNVQLSKHLDARLCMSSREMHATNKWGDACYEEYTVYTIDNKFYTINLKEMCNAHELSFEIFDMDYARKHCPNYILGTIIKEIENLRMSANF